MKRVPHERHVLRSVGVGTRQRKGDGCAIRLPERHSVFGALPLYAYGRALGLAGRVHVRRHELEFAAETKDGAKKTKLVLPEGFNHAPGHKKAAEPSFCFFACDELAAKEVRFSVTPVNCFGARGVLLVSEWVSL